MNIGEEKETKVIEPLVEPIPNAQPVPAPEPMIEPELIPEPELEPVGVPALSGGSADWPMVIADVVS